MAQQYDHLSFPHALLWKVEGNGIIQPVYIYGTIHEICSEYVFWNKEMDAVLAGVDKVYFEIDIKKLHSLYYKEDEVAFIDSLDNTRADILNNVSEFVFCEEAISYESVIYTKATNAKIPTAGLESVGSQMAIINKVYDPRIQIDYFKVINDLNDSYSSLLIQYVKQNINLLHQYTSYSLSFEQSRQLLDDRNKRWVLKFKQLVKNKSVFIAVGAAHLGGKNGVLNLLQEKGYRVRPVLEYVATENDVRDNETEKSE